LGPGFRFALAGNDNHTELCANSQAAGKKLLHAVGGRIRCHVIVHRLATENDIPHASAYQVSLMSRRAKCAADLFREWASNHGSIMSENGSR
jgi:hypothetical protein